MGPTGPTGPGDRPIDRVDASAEALMTSTERAPVNQLRTLWGVTVAAANFSLGEYIQLDPQASHI